ncbi:hypothetical protein HDE_02170 [Halotydeus destructor]|nr:hypothetical protein HDE_02170 [Halotydeus destructor]
MMSQSDSVDGQSNRTFNRLTKAQVDIDEAELLAGLGGVRQHDDEQIVFQVVQDTTGIQQQQIVDQLCTEDVASIEHGQGTESEVKQELTDEELQKELQELLDSQLEGQRLDDDTEIAKHLITNHEQLHEMDSEGQLEDQSDAIDQDGSMTPNKGFTISEIQAFMNNQIRKQHYQHMLGEENDNHLQLQQAASTQNQQRHIILVTENGDKIIFLQNSGVMDNEDKSESIVNYQQHFENDLEEEALIQLTARERRAAFVSQLEILREKHKRTLHIDVLTSQVSHLQPIKLVPYPKNGPSEEGSELCSPSNVAGIKRRPAVKTLSSGATENKPIQSDGQDGSPEPVSDSPKLVEIVSNINMESSPNPNVPTNEVSEKRSKRKSNMKNKKPVAPPPKWLVPVNAYLRMAQTYVKRREDKIDEVAKFFPPASSSFDERAKQMKCDFVKLELTVERFKNTIGKELEDISSKFKSFMRDYRLESVVGEIEAEDELDEFDENVYCDQIMSDQLTANKRKFPGKMKLIMPPSMTMTTSKISESGMYYDTEDRLSPKYVVDITPRTMVNGQIEDACNIVVETRQPEVSVSRVPMPRPIRSARIQQQMHEKQDVSQYLQKRRPGPGRPKKIKMVKPDENMGRLVKNAPTSFRCPIEKCGKYFLTNAVYKEHLTKLHGTATGSVAYSCPVENCDRTFAEMKVLQNHQLTAHNLGHYECSVCKFKNKSKDVIRCHVRDTHPEVYQDETFDGESDFDDEDNDGEDVYAFRDTDDFVNSDLNTSDRALIHRIKTVPKSLQDLSDDTDCVPSGTLGIRRPKPIRTTKVTPDLNLVDHDDSDIIKELGQMDVVRNNPDSFFAPVRKTPSISSASSPHPSVKSGNGNRKEDEISLECRSDCNFSAIDESSNADTFRTESPPMAEGTNPGHIDNTTPVEVASLASCATARSSGRPVRAAASRTPKWDTIIKPKRSGPPKVAPSPSKRGRTN